MLSMPPSFVAIRTALTHGIWFRLLNRVLADPLSETKNSQNARHVSADR
jgi:hypothetical protein